MILNIDELVRGDFDGRYWLDDSGLFKIENLLEMMEKKMGQENRLNLLLCSVLKAKSKLALIDKLMRHSVQRNRYMFVFDDDGFHQEFWHVIKQALHDNVERDTLITTAPSDQVVTCFEQYSFYEVRKSGPLSDEESWELFCRIAFQDEPEKHCPEEFRLLSEDIVKRCKGFPLPILGIAGWLSNKEKQELEWQRVRNGFKVEVKTNLQRSRVLDDSANQFFQDMPDHLWPCFRYFNLFPQDSVIPNEKLFKLWIAEGFVQGNGEKTLEEVAEEYLNELIHRNLVQSYKGLNRLEQFCRVDNVIYTSIIISAGRFCDKILCEEDTAIIQRSPRLSICSNKNVNPDNFNPCLRSLFVFGGNRDLTFMTALITQCALLTVLDFEYYSIEQLPEDFGMLIHLKYLSLKNTKLRKLSKSVGNLINLQTLDVRNTLLVELPVELNMLKNLRHLLANFCDDGISVDPIQGVRLKKGIGRLQNLQTITTMEAHEEGISIINELAELNQKVHDEGISIINELAALNQKVHDEGIGIINELAALNQLTTLGVSGLTAKTVKALCTGINKLVRLKSLTLQAKNGNEVLNLASISSKLPLLQRLVLKGMFQNLPNWIFHLQSLRVICLSLTQLTEAQLINLSYLPNLVTLWLCRAYKGAKLYFNQGSFEKLKLLVLREFHGLHELEIEDGALSSLEELRIGSSPFLDEVPSGILYLKNLKILIYYDMPEELVVSMQPNGGSDYWKVKHIPSVFFLYKIQGREYELFELGDSELVDHLEGLATSAYRVTEPQDEHEFTFCKSGDKDKDVVGPSSSYRATPNILQKHAKQWSFTSSMFTDDVEE